MPPTVLSLPWYGNRRKAHLKTALVVSNQVWSAAAGKKKGMHDGHSMTKKKKKNDSGGGAGNGKPDREDQPPLKHPVFDKLLSQGRQHVARIR